MNCSNKHLSYFITFLLIFAFEVFAQDSLDISGIVFNSTSTEGDYVTPEFLLPTLFDNIRVCQDITNQRQVEVSIDVNPIDPDNIVAAWIDFSYDAFAHVAYGYSFDGGQTWTDGGFMPINIGEYPFQGDPAVAADNDGNFFISFISFNDQMAIQEIFMLQSLQMVV